MKKLNLITLFIINFMFISPLRAETMEHCENIVKELLSVRSFPQRARIFTQLKPVCVKNDKGKVIFKMEMYANKNNDSRDAIRVDMVKGFIQNGQKMMCGQEDLKIIMNLIDIRIALRLEEDLNEVGHFDISEKICLANKQ